MRQLPQQSGPLGQLFALLGGAILLVLGFMFSMVVLAIAAVIGLVAFGYFWWKTRELRKVLREQQATAATTRPAGGEVFEGEAVVVEEYRAETQHIEAGAPEPPDSPGR
jgi:ABC-type bacteriocin/lantibiotic exporter with double-glycine peptidase domain